MVMKFWQFPTRSSCLMYLKYVIEIMLSGYWMLIVSDFDVFDCLLVISIRSAIQNFLRADRIKCVISFAWLEGFYNNRHCVFWIKLVLAAFSFSYILHNCI